MKKLVKAIAVNVVCFLLFLVCWALVLFFGVIFIGSENANANEVVKTRMINAIIGEAEGEPYKGKLAVSCAIINRVHTHGSFDKAMKGVYGEKSKRVVNKLYSQKTYDEAEQAYTESLGVGTCDFIDHADFWEGVSFKTPYWAKGMIVTATIGKQRFYRKK